MPVSIFGLVADMFRRLVALVLFLILIGLGLCAVLGVLIAFYYVHEGHL